MRRERIIFVGRVQGVGFRATAQRLAAGRPVTGWVRNEMDGGVMLEAQGAPAEIEALLARINSAMGSKVRGFSRTPVSIVEGEAAFVIAH